MKSFRDIRVIPVVLVAIFGLVVLKIAGLVIDGGYVFDYQPASSAPSWAQENLNFPGGKTDASDVTGSVEKPKEAEPAVAAPATKPEGVAMRPEESQPVSASERAVLERLQARRQELEARAREIDIRESLLKAAEKRIESRVEEMKAVESRMSTSTVQKAEAASPELEQRLTTFYEKQREGGDPFIELLARDTLSFTQNAEPRTLVEDKRLFALGGAGAA